MDDPLVQTPKPGKRARALSPEHTWRDLLYVGRAGDVVKFGAPSASDPERTNLVSYDVATRAVLCDCKHAETRPAHLPLSCWHAKVVEQAWWARQYQRMPTIRLSVLDAAYAAERDLTPEQLTRWGLVGEELGRRAALKGGGTRRKAVA